MSARDFSVMPVLLLPDERVSLTRAVKVQGGSARPGTICLVEFGATWADTPDGKRKVAGQWYQCVIERVVHSELHVRLSPDPKKAPATMG